MKKRNRWKILKMKLWNKFVSTMAKNKYLSKRMALSYSLLILVPLAVLFGAINLIIYMNIRHNVIQMNILNVQENAKRLSDNIKQMELIDKMINANSGLLLFLTNPEDYDTQTKIDTTITESVTMERILSVQPSMYGARIFTDREEIFERFPTILHSSRSNLADMEGWRFNFKENYFDSAINRGDSLVSLTRKLRYGTKRIGWIQVTMAMDKFLPFLYEPASEFHYNYVYSIDADGILAPINNAGINEVFPPLPDFAAKKLQRLYNASNHDKNITTHSVYAAGTTFIATWTEIPEIKSIVIHVTDTRTVLSSAMGISLISLICFAALGIGFYHLLTYVTERNLAGVYSIIDGMKEVRNGNFDVYIEVTNNDEVSETQRTFNSMITQLKNQIELIKKEQQLIADTEMKAMQNQINAHFLYNVLETIHMQAVLSDSTDTAESILVLGKMMRYCLRWRVHSVTLSQELEYINSYIYILNIRNDYEITLKTDIPQKYMDFTIPKMLIQPIVENSFYHAIEPFSCDSTIKIYTRIDTEKNILWLCVQDYGPGIDQQTLEGITEYLEDDTYERDSTGSIGIKNIQQRLTMFYGKEFRLKIDSEKNKGTLISIPVPFNRES